MTMWLRNEQGEGDDPDPWDWETIYYNGHGSPAGDFPPPTWLSAQRSRGVTCSAQTSNGR